MIIRQAEQGDLPYVYTMYREGLLELGETKLVESYMINKIVTSRQLAPCFVLTIDGIIRGMAGLTLVHSSHNGDAMLSEYMFYIQPKFRGLKHLSALVNKTKEFALAHNLPLRFDFLNQSVSPRVRERFAALFGFKVTSVVGEFNNG